LQASFVATSSDIDSWARVPTKRTGNIRNFQRAELPQHVNEVMRFFKDNDTNASPTAVVVGFDPIRSLGRIELVDAGGKAITKETVHPGKPVIGKLTITVSEEPDAKTTPELVQSIVEHFDLVQRFIFQELADITGLTGEGLKLLMSEFQDRAKQGKPDLSSMDASDEDDDVEPEDEDDDSGAAAGGGENDGRSSTRDLSDRARTALGGLTPSEQQVVIGRLEFLARMQQPILGDLPEDVLLQIAREVRDEVKPALLIDGQHRVMGTRGLPNIPFLVCAMPDAAWPELAFQFIVTNHTAKRVQESLLINIVGNSLSKIQRAAIEDRLRDSGIKVGLIEAVMKVHEDETSPFFGLLAFGLKDESGFLDAAALRNKVIQLWYERKTPVLELFDHFCQGRLKRDRTDYWKSEDLWFDFFIAFWSAVRERYQGSDVFSKELAEKGKKTPLRTPVSKLMTATVLKIFQETILANIAKYVREKEQKEGVAIADSIRNSTVFMELVKNSLKPLTPEFFQGWTITGFDGSRGARDDLAEAITLVVEDGKSVAVLKKQPHRLYKE